MGRKKIAIEPIEDLNKRYVAFSKRKDGLFNKAETACRMYGGGGSRIGILVFSPTAGKLHTFGPVDSLIHQFLLLHQSSSSPPPPPPHLNSTTTTTTTSTTEGKKRSRSDDDEQVLMMMEEEEREIKKKRKLLMTTTTTTEAAATATATATEEEEEEASTGVADLTALELDDDDELKEYLNGFADEIIAGNLYYEEKKNWSVYN